MEIKELCQVLELLGINKEEPRSDTEDHGFKIVVLDKGFVYVGLLKTDDKWLYMTDAKNIRYWGTTKGLGELAENGPLEETKIDKIPDIKAPLTELKHMINVKVSKW